eukprot:8158507-Lingulodinium_polyedra.AAC.1
MPGPRQRQSQAGWAPCLFAVGNLHVGRGGDVSRSARSLQARDWFPGLLGLRGPPAGQGARPGPGEES